MRCAGIHLQLVVLNGLEEILNDLFKVIGFLKIIDFKIVGGDEKQIVVFFAYEIVEYDLVFV